MRDSRAVGFIPTGSFHTVQPTLFVLPGFQPCSAVSQACVAARGVLARGAPVHVAGWGAENLVTNELREIGAVVHDLGRQRLLDLERLRQLVLLARSIRPETTVAWGQSALRLAAILPARWAGRLVGSELLPIADAVIARYRDRWLLSRLDRLIASGSTELAAAKQIGLPESRLALIHPGIAPPAVPEADSPAVGIDRYLLAVGPLERSKGLQDAIWAHEILKYLFEDLQLNIVGDGPDRDRLLHFVQSIEASGNVHFLGVRSDLDSFYVNAAAVWIPSLADRGVRVALEAMRAGCPVVATRQPRLAEIVVDGETGFLVPKGDKVALAKQTRKLLDDPRLADQMGQAGRRRVAEQFAAEPYITSLQSVLRG